MSRLVSFGFAFGASARPRVVRNRCVLGPCGPFRSSHRRRKPTRHTLQQMSCRGPETLSFRKTLGIASMTPIPFCDGFANLLNIIQFAAGYVGRLRADEDRQQGPASPRFLVQFAKFNKRVRIGPLLSPGAAGPAHGAYRRPDPVRRCQKRQKQGARARMALA